MLKREALAKLYSTKQGKYRWKQWRTGEYIYYCTRYNMLCWDNGKAYDTSHGILEEEGWEEYKEPVVVVGLEALFKKHKELGKKDTYWTCSEYKSVAAFRAQNFTDDKDSTIDLFWPSGAHVVVDNRVACATYTLVSR